MRIPFSLPLAFVFFIEIACSCGSIPDSKTNGDIAWVGEMHTAHADIPFRFLRNDSGLIIVNGEEQIAVKLKEMKGDTLIFSFPHYHNSSLIAHESTAQMLRGVWDTGRQGHKHIPFTARLSSQSYSEVTEAFYDDFYDVEFSPEKSTRSSAVGAFNFNGPRSVGTFLTATGDYRYLEGEKSDSTFWLSTFDGSHLFLAAGSINASGMITGKFYSGNNPVKPWIGLPNSTPELPLADSLTFLLSGDAAFSFLVWNFAGDTVQFDEKDFAGKVTVVSIFGSWCPNCHDELKLYSQFHKQIKDNKFQVIPVAFERDSSRFNAEKRVQAVFQSLDIPFQSFYGGIADKSVASSQFPMLDEVKAFPTSIIIGKDGTVRKIHTGFSGPGTGVIYSQYKEELSDFIEHLLAE